MSLPKYLIILPFTLFFIGCQTTHEAKVIVPDGNHLYKNELFKGYEDVYIVSEEDIFSIDDDMLEFVETEINSKRDFDEKARALVSWVYNNTAGGVNYDAAATITATEAFHKNKANCLSLTILTHVLAEASGLKADFQQIRIPEYWYRQGDYNLLAGHVNLRLKVATKGSFQIAYGSSNLEIDFDPYSIRQHFKKRIIDRNTILAMYYNNLAGQAMVDKEYVKAYALLKEATIRDPSFSSAWANLGLLYKFNHALDLAEKTYLYALQFDSKNLNLLDNLAILLMQTDREEAALAYKSIIQKKREDNPYYYAMLADEAFHQDKLTTAIENYRKAIRLYDKEHEFYYGLARVYYKRGDYERSRELMKKAIKHNEFHEVERRYVAKLASLKGL